MFVVVFWHIWGIHSSWTDGWVMPVFFFIMGMFYRQDASLKKIVFKKLNTLVVPILFCSLPALAESWWNSHFEENSQSIRMYKSLLLVLGLHILLLCCV